VSVVQSSRDRQPGDRSRDGAHIYIYFKTFYSICWRQLFLFYKSNLFKINRLFILLLLLIALRPNMGGTSPRLPNMGGISHRFAGNFFSYALVKFRLSGLLSIFFLYEQSTDYSYFLSDLKIRTAKRFWIRLSSALRLV
jgi:hypothetical protein